MEHVIKEVIRKIISFLIFLVIVLIAKFLIPYVNNEAYAYTVLMLFASLWLLALILGLDVLNGIFWSFKFPWNIPAPVISAVLAIYITEFVYELVILVDRYAGIGINLNLHAIQNLVFILAILIGFIVILSRIGERKRNKIDIEEEKLKPEEEKKGWKHAWHVFGMIFYNIGKSINNLFEKKGKKKGKK